MPLMWRAARPMVWIRLRSGAQEALLVGVEDRDQRHFGDVEPLAQQVDADQHVELAQPAGRGQTCSRYVGTFELQK